MYKLLDESLRVDIRRLGRNLFRFGLEEQTLKKLLAFLVGIPSLQVVDDADHVRTFVRFIKDYAVWVSDSSHITVAACAKVPHKMFDVEANDNQRVVDKLLLPKKHAVCH